MSPMLFCIFFDELLGQLARSGIGCHVGHMYVGALSYADDIVLLAPTRNAASRMLLICEEFSSNFDVLFNASKSLFVVHHCRRKRDYPPLKLKGSNIDQYERANHLGQLIGHKSAHEKYKKCRV